MNNRTFEYITEFVGGLHFPGEDYLCENRIAIGETILDDSFAGAFEKIISKRLESPLKKSGARQEMSPEKSRKLIIGLNPAQKFNLFFLITYHYYNFQYNELHLGFETHLKNIAQVLDVGKKDYQAVLDFYGSELPFTDKAESIYFTGTNKSQLVSSGGINVKFVLKKNNETIYLKYLKGYNFFLSKTFHSDRPANSITEDVLVKDINVVTKENFHLLRLEKFNFADCRDLISGFVPFNNIFARATSITPEIVLDAVQSEIIISGHSTPMSPTNYFDPVYEWLHYYGIYGKDSLDVRLKLSYYNTYTSKFILRLVVLCKKLDEAGKKINIFWYYTPGDEEVKEFGEQVQAIYKRKFVFLSMADKVEI